MSETAIDELLEKWDEEHVLTKEEALAILNLPDDKLDKLIETAYALRLKYKGKKVSIQLLTNVSSGSFRRRILRRDRGIIHITFINADLFNVRADT